MESMEFTSAKALFDKERGGAQIGPQEDANVARKKQAELTPEAEADKTALHDVGEELTRIRREREERDRKIAELQRTVAEPVPSPAKAPAGAQEPPAPHKAEGDIPKAFLDQRKVLKVPEPEIVVPAPVTTTPDTLEYKGEELTHADRHKRAKCESCGYVWQIRGKREPKACPRCKSRLDYGDHDEAGRVRVQKALRVIIRDLRRPRKGYADLQQDPEFPAPEELSEVLRAYLDSI